MTVKTYRSGHFKFTIGLDLQKLEILIVRVNDAKERFNNAPKVPDVLNRLENHVVVSSIYGTNTIEGGTLSLEETGEVILRDTSEILAEDELRVKNLSGAYGLVNEIAEEVYESADHNNVTLHITEDMLKKIHYLITVGLTHEFNTPGKYRNNEKGRHETIVGSDLSGSKYKPPKCLADVEMLMKAFIEWINSESIKSLPILIRAPLAHYYFELIHPFWDGNGRVGRVLESLILKLGRYKYASREMSRYYQEHQDEYFTVFNVCRKSAEKNKPSPNMAFAEFFLKGMLEVINKNHDYINEKMRVLLFESRLRSSLDSKEINNRQYTIVSNLMLKKEARVLSSIKEEPWYTALYLKLTRRTADRDLEELEKAEFIKIEKKQVRLLLP